MIPPDLPNTSEWQPRETAAETIQTSFLHRSRSLEKQILLRSKLEREMNIDNFDSGIAVEEIVRESQFPMQYGA